MVRWTQLSHFPCATLCIRNGRIHWGFVSELFRECGLWKTTRGFEITSADAKRFLELDSSLAAFREGTGSGLAQYWLEGDCDRVDVQEYYVVIPYSKCIMVFVTADEGDLPSRWDDDH